MTTNYNPTTTCDVCAVTVAGEPIYTPDSGWRTLEITVSVPALGRIGQRTDVCPTCLECSPVLRKLVPALYPAPDAIAAAGS